MKMNGVIFRKIKVIEETIRKLRKLGVYFTEPVKGDALINFMVEAAEAADFDVIDFVDLYSTETILAFEVISGNFICKNDPEKTAELFSLISRKYEEAMCRLNHAA